MNSQDFACIRPFRISDLRAVLELIHGTIDISYSAFYPPRAIQFFKEFHSEEMIMRRFGEGEILVVEKDGTIIGTGSLVGKDILGVFIHAGLQHQGYGKSMMQALEQKAVLAGIEEIELSISLPSRKFYENLGYEIIASRTVDVGEGQQLDYWQAKKILPKETLCRSSSPAH